MDNKNLNDCILKTIVDKYRVCSAESIKGPDKYLQTTEISCYENDNGINTHSISERMKDENNCSDIWFNGGKLHAFCIGGEDNVCIEELIEIFDFNDETKRYFQFYINELMIYCHLANEKQLESLKKLGIIKWTNNSAKLITKTDIYRLFDVLENEMNNKTNSKRKTPKIISNSQNGLLNDHFDVFHECFNGCDGRFFKSLFKDIESKCIECKECRQLLSTSRFVWHCHTNNKNTKTIHWGFDDKNWANYIKLSWTINDVETFKFWNQLIELYSRNSPSKHDNNIVDNEIKSNKKIDKSLAIFHPWLDNNKNKDGFCSKSCNEDIRLQLERIVDYSIRQNVLLNNTSPTNKMVILSNEDLSLRSKNVIDQIENLLNQHLKKHNIINRNCQHMNSNKASIGNDVESSNNKRLWQPFMVNDETSFSSLSSEDVRNIRNGGKRSTIHHSNDYSYQTPTNPDMYQMQININLCK